MSASSAPFFRLLDLPSEMRNRIYQFMLCVFDSAPPPVEFFCELHCLSRARHNINAAILRTSRQVYCEAYSVMVKTNKFVGVTSVIGLPLMSLLKGYRVPIVTGYKPFVYQFKGYALGVHLYGHGFQFHQSSHGDNPHFQAQTLMILHRDIDRFCRAIAEGDLFMLGFTRALGITIEFAPCLNIMTLRQSVEGSPIFSTFNRNNTQRRLLRPFYANFRGFKAVNLTGRVIPALRNAILTSMALMKYPNHAAVIESLRTAHNKGWMYMREGEPDKAISTWYKGMIYTRKVHNSSSWPFLNLNAHHSFLLTFTYVWFKLVVAILRSPLHKKALPTTAEAFILQDALFTGMQSQREGFWLLGQRFEMEEQDRGWLFYHAARWIRERDLVDRVEYAHDLAVRAVDLLPGVQEVEDESDRVRMWYEENTDEVEDADGEEEPDEGDEPEEEEGLEDEQDLEDEEGPEEGFEEASEKNKEEEHRPLDD